MSTIDARTRLEIAGQPSRTRVDLNRLATRVVAPVIAFAVVVFLATFKLGVYPTPWFDEGMNLLAGKALAQTGLYGLPSSDGFRLFDPILSTGPTVIAPIALMFKLFGAGLIQARAVAAAYVIVAAVGLYWIGRRFYGPSVAVAAIFVFASLTTAGPIANGRFALGDVAALAFLFMAIGILTCAESARGGQAVLLLSLAGVALGLTVLTKTQFFFVIPVAVLFVAVRGRNDLRSLVGTACLACFAMLPLLCWYGYELSVLGLTSMLEHVRTMSQQTSASVYVKPLSLSKVAVQELLNSGFFLWGLPGLVYAWLAHARDNNSLRSKWSHLILLTFVTIWMVLFVALSAGWTRYSVAGVVTCSLFEAALFIDLASRAFGWHRPWDMIGVIRSNASGFALCLAIVGAIGSGIALNAITIAKADDTSASRFAAFVSEQVEPGAVVETYEWEIGFLANETYHYPPISVGVDAERRVVLHADPLSPEPYRVPLNASYLIVGPFAKSCDLYVDEVRSAEFQLVGSRGGYDLYKRA